MLGTESAMTLNFTHHRSFGIRLGGESLREDKLGSSTFTENRQNLESFEHILQTEKVPFSK